MLLAVWQAKNAAGLSKCQFNFYSVAMSHFWRRAKGQAHGTVYTNVPRNGSVPAAGHCRC